MKSNVLSFHLSLTNENGVAERNHIGLSLKFDFGRPNCQIAILKTITLFTFYTLTLSISLLNLYSSCHQYVPIYVCMYVFMYVCNACMHVCMFVCMYVCMYVYMYVCTHVCMYVTELMKTAKVVPIFKKG